MRLFGAKSERQGMRESLDGGARSSKRERVNMKVKGSSLIEDAPASVQGIDLGDESGKKLFEGIEYDDEGRHLVFHHFGAARYYKINAVFLALFLGLSYYQFKENSAIFLSDTFGKIYLGVFAGALAALYIYSNKHIQAVYLLKPASKELAASSVKVTSKDGTISTAEVAKQINFQTTQRVGIITYSNFGFTRNRLHEIEVNKLRGSRSIVPIGGVNLFQLEYFYHGRMTNIEKKRSFFFRPHSENIPNQDLWKEIRAGNEIMTLDDIQSSKELEYHRKMKRKSSALSKYK